MQKLEWSCRNFEALSSVQLYAILKLRTEVFVVEQNCVYQDMDDFDQGALHVTAYRGNELVCYARLLQPGIKYKEPSMGRIICALNSRQLGFGKKLVERSLEYCNENWPDLGVRISAQQQLEKFYAGFGFMTVSEPYLEDGLPHLEMLRDPS